jgi:hypothetical protein
VKTALLSIKQIRFVNVEEQWGISKNEYNERIEEPGSENMTACLGTEGAAF